MDPVRVAVLIFVAMSFLFIPHFRLMIPHGGYNWRNLSGSIFVREVA